MGCPRFPADLTHTVLAVNVVRQQDSVVSSIQRDVGVCMESWSVLH